MTAEGIHEIKNDLQLQLYTLTSIVSRKQLGLPVTKLDNEKLFNAHGQLRIPILTQELKNTVDTLTESYVDVTEQIQQIVTRNGGGAILIARNTNLTKLCGGNPNPGKPKQLRIDYSVLGHDSERMTYSNEITYPSGFPRNYILPREDHFIGEVIERTEGEGRVSPNHRDDDYGKYNVFC